MPWSSVQAHCFFGGVVSPEAYTGQHSTAEVQQRIEPAKCTSFFLGLQVINIKMVDLLLGY
jgi:hypothetical protein